MEYTIENEKIRLVLTDAGAQIRSLIGKENGCEYIWYGNPEFWSGRAPLMFPYCCRLFGGYFTYEGKKYEGGGHGFARNSVFATEVNRDSVTFTLESDENTKKLYPFDFILKVIYSIKGSSVGVSISVENIGNLELIYACGGHPGFNVPLDGTKFEDWYIEFPEKCEPKKIVFSDACFCTGERAAFGGELEDGRRLALRHGLFDDDAIFLENTPKSVTLKSDKSDRFVTVAFPDMKYVGFWHTRRADAPFLCIEPMNGLPSREGVVDDLSEKGDMRRLAPRDSHTDSFSITVG